MRSFLTALSVASVLAIAAPSPSDLKADEAQLKDVIQGVVGRYLGDSNESKVLSSALMKAFEDEGVGEDSDSKIKASTPSPSSSSTVSLEKRDIRADALPPPELFLDLLGEDLDSHRRPALHMEIAGNAKRNCTKRKRRRKKSKVEPIKLPVGRSSSSRPDQRETSADFTNFGVPPAHLEIPRLSASDHKLFGDEGASPRRAASSREDSHLAHLPDVKQRSQDKLVAYSDHAPTTYPLSSSYFSLGSTAKPGGARRNPFERFEQATSPPYREEVPVSRDALVPKRTKSREPRTTTPNPLSGFASLDDGSSDRLLTSEPNKPSRIPTVRLTTLEPPADPPQRQPESAQYSFLPKSTTTSRPQTTSSQPSRGPEGNYRTLVPSSLNKGTLQHFSLYPKQPQSNSFSKIILAVGGARYAPLPLNFTSNLYSGLHSSPNSTTGADSALDSTHSASDPDFSDRTASPSGFYGTVVAKQTSSLAAADESLVIQTPTSRLLPKYSDVPLEGPGTLLPMSPKVVSGQVLVFSSHNQPDDTEIAQNVHGNANSRESGTRGRFDLDNNFETTTSSPQRTTDCVTHAAATTTKPEFGARMVPPSSNARKAPVAESQTARRTGFEEPKETSSDQGFMPDAPTILMQVS